MEAVTNPNTMTLDELRDWCAVDAGWRKHTLYWHPFNVPGMEAARNVCYLHPFPKTLDGAARALPEGWKWEKRTHLKVGAEWNQLWWAECGSIDVGPFRDTGDEILDRYRLAVACRKAEHERT
jgi:hypothetical protein